MDDHLDGPREESFRSKLAEARMESANMAELNNTKIGGISDSRNAVIRYSGI